MKSELRQRKATNCGDLEWEGLAGPCCVILEHRTNTTLLSLSKFPTAHIVNETEEPDSFQGECCKLLEVRIYQGP